MTDQETIARFIFMRSQGWSFNRIAAQLRSGINQEIGGVQFSELADPIPARERLAATHRWTA